MISSLGCFAVLSVIGFALWGLISFVIYAITSSDYSEYSWIGSFVFLVFVLAICGAILFDDVSKVFSIMIAFTSAAIMTFLYWKHIQLVAIFASVVIPYSSSIKENMKKFRGDTNQERDFNLHRK